MMTIADLKGKKVVSGFSAQRTLDISGRAVLAAGGLGDKDYSPVLVPNVIRGADDFVAGASDTFFFAFGAPKVREVDATVGGIRALEVPESGMAAARKIFPEGYLLPATPSPFYHRRREADGGLHLGQSAVHQRQGEGRGRLQADRHHDEATRPISWPCSRRCGP